MSDRLPPSNHPSRTPANRSLLERVRARVLNTTHALQRRDAGSTPRVRPSRPAGKQSADGPASVQLSHELRALQVVYHALARSHRQYRERSGDQVPPALKAAARAFKREPSVFSLVPVAGFLDDLGLLKW